MPATSHTSDTTSVDFDDPWARLEAARARRAQQSPFAQRQSAPEQAQVASQPGAEPTAHRSLSAPRGQTARTRVAPLSTQQRERMLELAEQGCSAPRIAKELEVHADRVRTWAKAHSITLPDGRTAGGPGRTAAWDVKRAVALAGDGLTAKQIAQAVGAKTETVRRVLKNRGVKITSSYPRRDG